MPSIYPDLTSRGWSGFSKRNLANQKHVISAVMGDIDEALLYFFAYPIKERFSSLANPAIILLPDAHHDS